MLEAFVKVLFRRRFLDVRSICEIKILEALPT
jgi:hypothetical protein